MPKFDLEENKFVFDIIWKASVKIANYQAIMQINGGIANEYGPN